MKKIVVIGNGMVGYKFCEKLRAKSKIHETQLIIFGEEFLPAYDRVHLSEYFTDKSADSLYMAPAGWYTDNGVDLRTGELVTHIDRSNQKVTTHKGNTESYDYLILAMGSKPLVPAIEGVNRNGVFVYRTIEDLENIIEYSKKAKTAAVLGGGLLGLEAAKALIDMKLDTHVIEFADRLMPRQLDVAGSEMLKNSLESLGLNIHLNRKTKSIEGTNKPEIFVFQDGKTLEADMLVISCGIVPRDELARECGLETGIKGGIVVNEKLRTQDENIFAIGEVALVNGMVYGLVAPGYEMAEVVVDQIVDSGIKSFRGSDMSTKLKLIGIEVASFGNALDLENEGTPIVFQNSNKGIYKRINISRDGTRLLGGILVGDSNDYNMLMQMMQNGMALPPDPEDIILGVRGGEEPDMLGSLPDEAQICSCENVTKGDIVNAIKEGELEDIAQVKTRCKAGTGCGACTPMVNDILQQTFISLGKRLRNIICEHFDYTRQELFDLVKVTKISSFNQLLEEYGCGSGCEVCKPAVASIMASIFNELIVKHDTIQDTNDKYLANIQKGGSYSVVPRVPGGEITPEKLIVLGEVAKKYNLYTKITGGQRIDLFGARLNDLPQIWKALVEAGFESGHAYGKSLRTVKSCVGSSWCRYGLHDSVSFAIEVEERYRGLRSPHKLKGGVSGCRRECAEAQSKDFGIIATERGWNLYVCGNGGANPQHAQLLVGDIDKDTCIKYLDRFLIFYIRTAEPLNRTATWLNKLDGGLEYLYDVVVNDCLGIGEELERDMQFMIDTYACEWKEVVENEALQAKFRHFVNSEEHDPAQQFGAVRGQKVPVNWS